MVFSRELLILLPGEVQAVSAVTTIMGSLVSIGKAQLVFVMYRNCIAFLNC